MRFDKIIEDIKEWLKFYSEIERETYLALSLKENNFEKLEILKEKVKNCKKCNLSSSRINPVFGEGNIEADLMFIGEAPGEEEDKRGRPFVGRAGQLLTKIILAMKLKREDVYITNVVKCRPPRNRDPKNDEISTCLGYLIEQIKIIKPKVIVTLGRIPAKVFIKSSQPITRLRGNFYDYQGIKLLPTYHPSYLIRNESNIKLKKEVWSDMKKVMAFLGLE
ncbi:uracil-DNA glycosylase [Candidatus Aminicenantes bacterium AC-708-M15]|jgi:DNA polymerase|nr:uracil-DNA glycosylase [SCandidatus Aminicenantes bacterium Aminicenantia_JdfR_composite]MCP2596362.1 uracil-DNA glycosylase [Candidatus Aminicenantes bacterium AC-335-G13]MCP2604109.1 uracil-DNA glycosylase [Candidatus Aminicenantes bacterium AC-708-M15]MCP2605398.1 uracil-DNA glycosylase [Candidatus Aminicenantes bacterium AC-335-O07]MCP2605992.1 uracil-DNA glycosylase [Candidatus Aminicenantes bacterium AC-708-I09]MCP2617835.1 uracil-DNA glycosylase [Candidatus Aminicenantes bacterium AC